MYDNDIYNRLYSSSGNERTLGSYMLEKDSAQFRIDFNFVLKSYSYHNYNHNNRYIYIYIYIYIYSK